MERTFDAQGRHRAKRRALTYWYLNRDELGLSLAEFLGRCRVTHRGDLIRIIFAGHSKPA
jgi:hypothetical protein